MVPQHRLLLICLTALVGLAAGCQLPGRGGPIPQSLATCRQYSRQGIAALEREQWQQAETLLADAVRACPVDADARRSYAEALWHRDQRDKAIAELEHAAGLAPDDPSLQVRLAEMLLESGQVQRARQCSELALDLDPKLASAWAVKARTSLAGGDMPSALADYHRALAEEPSNQAILLEVAELYARTHEPQKALATLHTLADTYPPGEEPQQVLYQQGLAYRALGRAADAAESLAGAANRERPNTEVLYRLAEAELAAGQRDRAAQAAWQALALDPEHAASRELLVRLGANPGASPPLRR